MLSNSAIYVCLLFSGQSFGNRISLLLIIIQHNEVRTTDRVLVFMRKLMKSSLNTNRVIAADWTCCRRYGNTRKFKEIYKLYWRMILVDGSEQILWMRCITLLLRLRLCSCIYSCFILSYENLNVVRGSPVNGSIFVNKLNNSSFMVISRILKLYCVLFRFEFLRIKIWKFFCWSIS